MDSSTVPSNATAMSNTDRIYIDNPPERRSLFGIVGVLSILCNGALCTVVLINRRMLRNSYNVLVLILAVIDTTTGFFIISSPSLVIGNEVMPVPMEDYGRAFCILLQRNFFVWMLANFSVSVVACMAVERWYALVHPHKYKIFFSVRKTLMYAAVSCGTILLIVIPVFYDATDVKPKGSKMICFGKPVFGKMLTNQIYVIFYCTATSFIPFLVITFSYLHIRFSVISHRQSPVTNAQRSRQQLKVNLSRMSAVTALVLAFFLFPSKIAYVLFMFDLTTWDMVHRMATLGVLNSVVNPWIYCLTNKVYRRAFAELFCCCKKREKVTLRGSVHSRSGISHVTSLRSSQVLPTIELEFAKQF